MLAQKIRIRQRDSRKMGTLYTDSVSLSLHFHLQSMFLSWLKGLQGPSGSFMNGRTGFWGILCQNNWHMCSIQCAEWRAKQESNRFWNMLYHQRSMPSQMISQLLSLLLFNSKLFFVLFMVLFYWVCIYLLFLLQAGIS